MLAALADARSMAEAARALGVDKATVSRHLSDLEHSAPAPLFERRERGIAVTPYGARALDAHAEHERSRERLEAELETTEQDRRGVVRVTAPSFFACDVIVPALPHFCLRHPELTVQLEATSAVLDLTTGEADVALRNLRPTDPNLVFRKLGRLGMSLYASPDYLARRGGLPGDRSLRGHDFISYDTGHYAGHGFAWLPGAAAEAHVVFAANDALALRDAAAAGLGLAVLPHCLAEGVPHLQRVPGGGDGATDILVVVHAARRRIPRVQAVMRFLADLVHSAQPRLFVA